MGTPSAGALTAARSLLWINQKGTMLRQAFFKKHHPVIQSFEPGESAGNTVMFDDATGE